MGMKTKHNAVFSFVFSFTSFIPYLNYFFAPLSLLIAVRAYLEIKRNPKVYYGLKWTYAAITIAVVLIILSIINLFLPEIPLP